MQLINVVSAVHTAVEGWLDLSVEANIGNGPEILPFTYAPGDPHGLTPQVGAWLAAHPDFPVEEYVAPPEASPYLPLKPYQFWGAVRATGHEIDLRTWVDTIADPVQKGIASAMLEFSLEFRRDHPLIEAARIHLGMTESELNDLWLWGLTL